MGGIENSSLQDRVVLITGGARRVGAAMVRTLHAAGANVLVHYHSASAAAIALTGELNGERSGSAACYAADVRDVDALDRLVAATLREFGALDLLINNASSFYPTPVGAITTAQWDDRHDRRARERHEPAARVPLHRL